MPEVQHNQRGGSQIAEARPMETLEHEHKVIQRVVAGMAILAAEVQRGVPVGPELLQDIIGFFGTFVEQCHHAKEERVLFPILESRGIPAGGCPIAALHNEHEKGRALQAQLEAAAEAHAQGAPDQATLASTLRGIVELYPGHMWKEDFLLLPMARKVLSDGDLICLAADFEAIDEEIGPGVHERLEGYPDQLDRALQALGEGRQIPSGPIRKPAATGSPILEFDLAGEIEGLRREPGWQSGRDSMTIVKHSDFRIVLTALRAGSRIREHQASGRISVQTIMGHIRMHVPGRVVDLPAGHMLALDRAMPHDVEALEDSAFLLTIAWPEAGSHA